jgi:xylulokinase
VNRERGREDLFVLAVDLGTGGPKVGLVSLDGTIACREHQAVETRFGPGGEATQDAEEWWRLVLAAARRAMASGIVSRGQVVAVSCTGQWASTVPVDAKGLPVGDCLLWSDTRGGPLAREAVGGWLAGYAPLAALRFIRRSGGAPSTSGADPIGHMLYIEAHQPEVASATRYYLEPVDYLSMRFCGVPAASPASMAAAWLTDNRSPEPLSYDPLLVASSGVPAEKLPPLRPTASAIGTISPDVATTLGIDERAVVVAGTPDLHSAWAGSGAVGERAAHIAISTTSWVSCPLRRKKTDPIRQIATVPGVVPGLRLVANNQETGGRALEWLRMHLSESGVAPSFEELDDLAARAEPGSGRLLFTPWLDGERSPIDDRRARAGFHNLSLQTSRADLARSVLEGVAFNSRWLLEAVERFVGRAFPSVRVIGGGATSRLWCSIYADVLGKRVEQVADARDANLRGSALLAGLALGRLRWDELPDLVPVEAVHFPDPRTRSVYDELFAQFPAFYKAQKRMFSRTAPRRRALSAG